jgi:hypothetical protein
MGVRLIQLSGQSPVSDWWVRRQRWVAVALVFQERLQQQGLAQEDCRIERGRMARNRQDNNHWPKVFLKSAFPPKLEEEAEGDRGRQSPAYPVERLVAVLEPSFPPARWLQVEAGQYLFECS